MRIAYVCADQGVPVFAHKGCSIHVQEVLGAMIRRGARPALFACRFDGEAPPQLAGTETHQLPSAPRDDPEARERAALAANEALRSLLEQHGPFDLVYERYSLWSYAGMEYAARSHTPGLLEVNAPLIEEQAAHRTLVNRHLAEIVAQRAMDAASAIIAISKELADYLHRTTCANGRVHIIPNGTHPTRFSSVEQANHNGSGYFTVGFVGSMKPWHGLPTLINAFDDFHCRRPRSRLLLVGDGAARSELETSVAARGLHNAVRFTGMVSPAQVACFLGTMDVAVAPYPNCEHFYFSPLKVLEYMAAGLPVVASRIGSLAELIEDGVSGVLCPPGDAAALADGLEQLHDQPELRRRLGQAARAAVLRDHTWDAVVERILKLADDCRSRAGAELPEVAV